MGSGYSSELLKPREEGPSYNEQSFDIEYVQLDENRKIATCFQKCKDARCTILFCGDVTGTDMGLYHRWLKILGEVLKANTLAFDYGGYGLSEATVAPTEKRIFEDTAAVHKYMISKLGVDPSSVVVYGRGTGSGPAMHLAASLCKRQPKSMVRKHKRRHSRVRNSVLRKRSDASNTSPFGDGWSDDTAMQSGPEGMMPGEEQQIGSGENEGESRISKSLDTVVVGAVKLAALILQSPMKSVLSTHERGRMMRVTLPDMFENAKRADKVSVPVILIHGTDDELIPYGHSETLVDKFPRAELVAIDGASHWNIEQSFSDDLLDPLVDFLKRSVPGYDRSTIHLSLKNSSDPTSFKKADGKKQPVTASASAKHVAARGYGGPPIKAWLAERGLAQYTDAFVMQLFVNDPLFLQSCTDAELMSAVTNPKDCLVLFEALQRTPPDALLESTATSTTKSSSSSEPSLSLELSSVKKSSKKRISSPPKVARSLSSRITSVVQTSKKSNDSGDQKSTHHLRTIKQSESSPKLFSTHTHTPNLPKAEVAHPPGLGLSRGATVPSVIHAGKGDKMHPRKRATMPSPRPGGGRGGSMIAPRPRVSTSSGGQPSSLRRPTLTAREGDILGCNIVPMPPGLKSESASASGGRGSGGGPRGRMTEKGLVMLGRTVSVRLNRLRFSEAGNSLEFEDASATRADQFRVPQASKKERPQSQEEESTSSLNSNPSDQNSDVMQKRVPPPRPARPARRVRLRSQRKRKSNRAVLATTERIDKISYTQEVAMLNELLQGGLISEEEHKKKKRKLRKKFKSRDFSSDNEATTKLDVSRGRSSSRDDTSVLKPEPSNVHGRSSSGSSTLQAPITRRNVRSRSPNPGNRRRRSEKLRPLAEMQGAKLSVQDDAGPSRRRAGSSVPRPKPRIHKGVSPNSVPSQSQPLPSYSSGECGASSDETIKTRDEIIRELCSTEQDYLQSLTIITENLSQLKQSDPVILSPEEYKSIFSEIEVICSFSSKFLKQLEKRIADQNQDILIGDLLITMLPFLSVYERYVRRIASVEQVYKIVRKANKRFRAHCNAIAKKYPSLGGDYDILLKVPCNRLQEYNILVQEIVKRTTKDEHEDKENVEETAQKLLDVALESKLYLLCADAAESMRSLRDRLEDTSIVRSSKRRLLFSSPVEIVGAKKSFKYVALFAQVIVFFMQGDHGKKLIEPMMMSLDRVWLNVNQSKLSISGGKSSNPRAALDVSTSSNDKGVAGLSRSQSILDLNKQSAGAVSVSVIYPGHRYTLQFEQVEQTDKFLECIRFAIAQSVRRINNKLQSPYKIRSFEHEFTNGDVYEGEWLKGEPHGHGEMRRHGGDVCSGRWVQGKLHGFGEIRFATGEVFSGDWVNGLPHGNGRVESDGHVYLGKYEAGRRCGRGKLTWQNGWSYSGEWLEDRMSGSGTLCNPSGVVLYQGKYLNGKMHGAGVLTTDLGVYEGSFVNGMMHGLGSLKYSDGGEYRGPFEFGLRSGNDGKYISEDGSISYKGSWKHGLYHGSGRLTIAGKFTYIGEFEYGQRHGEGKCVCPNSWTYNGHWDRDSRHGQGSIKYEDGTTFEGIWERNLPHGEGIWKDASTGSSYKGSWQFGARHGYGFMQSAGSVYDGHWENGLKHGKGKLVSLASATMFEGQWRDGQREGEGTMKFPSGVAYKQKYQDGKLPKIADTQDNEALHRITLLPTMPTKQPRF